MMRKTATRTRMTASAVLCGLALAVGAGFAVTASQPAGPFDTVLAGGRVMDPASGLDAVRHVGIRAGTIAAVSTTPLMGTTNLDVTGLVVAPGFIDPHAHWQTMEGNRYQARDGVTTALELESGAMPIDDWYASRDGRALINYGATVGHIYARVSVMHEKGSWQEINATRQSTADPRPDWSF